MIAIGLTGGIGTGKSTVSEFISDRGYTVIDADKISHSITEKGNSALDEIKEAFGEEMILPDGSLNRKGLAEIVFSDAEKKQTLEEIITARVIDIIKERVNLLRRKDDEDIIFVDAPLLFETGADKLVDEVWLVTSDLEVRIDRVMKRDNATREQVISRISNQMSTEEKAKLSDWIIDNSEGKEELYCKVKDLLEKYVNR